MGSKPGRVCLWHPLRKGKECCLYLRMDDDETVTKGTQERGTVTASGQYPP